MGIVNTSSPSPKTATLPLMPFDLLLLLDKKTTIDINQDVLLK